MIESCPAVIISVEYLPNSAIDIAPVTQTLILFINLPVYVSNILTNPSVDAVRIN